MQYHKMKKGKKKKEGRKGRREERKKEGKKGRRRESYTYSHSNHCQLQGNLWNVNFLIFLY